VEVAKSLDYTDRTWRAWSVVGTDVTLGEPLQIHVFLVPREAR
jgi:hypothetical protein